jgi:hypothetical protein
MRPSRTLLMTAASALAGMFATGCASVSSTDPGGSLLYKCCFMEPDLTLYQPRQQMSLGWLPNGTTTGNKIAPQLVLSAELVGPYRTVSDLQAANEGGPDQSHIVATAPVITLSSVPVMSPTSVLTIPPSAAPGYYVVWSTAAAGGTSNSGGVNITVG